MLNICVKAIKAQLKSIVMLKNKNTDQPDEADFGLVFISKPKSGTGYSKEDELQGGNGYVLDQSSVQHIYSGTRT